MGFSEVVALRGVATPYELEILAASGGQPDLDALIRAVIARESAWNPGAIRPEPQIGDASYGLMQVLLGTARMIRPGTTPSDLFLPSVNIAIGSAYLKEQIARYGFGPDAISAYNAGRPIAGNAAHVADVMAYWAWYLDAFMGSSRMEAPPAEGDAALTEWMGDAELPPALLLALAVVALVALS